MSRKLIGTSLLAFVFSLVFSSCGVISKKDEEPGGGIDSDPFTTFFEGEVLPSAPSACFKGAYYRKVVSSKDLWLGLDGKIVLPEIVFDQSRINPAKPIQ